uniref:Uncharacterized protein n=1 Tax=Clytia hemisphaerica TaxID=252671 RepID=A0A7M5XDJ7_9CNID
MPAEIDVLLPKHVTDSCYASLTQIYRDMFELTPKSKLKPSTHSNRLSFKSSPPRYLSSSSSNIDSENVFVDMYQDRKPSLTRLFSKGSLKKSTSAKIDNYPFYSGENISHYRSHSDTPGQYYGDNQNYYGDKQYYYGDKDARRSDRRFDKSYYYGNYKGNFDKKNKMRASWHEGDTKRTVVGTKIEFVTKF